MAAELSPEATISDPGMPPTSGSRPANGAGPGPSAAGGGPSVAGGGPSVAGDGPSAVRGGWTARRVIALVAGAVLLVVSGGFLGAGAVLTWTVIVRADVDATSPALPWLAGELLAAAIMVGVLAAALIAVPVRMASSGSPR